jgi:hypothetical protein
MGFKSLVVLFVCISFALLIGLPQNMSGYNSGTQNNTFGKINSLTTSVQSSMNGTSIDTILFGTIVTPNPFSLFKSVVDLFVSLVSLPTDVIGSLFELPSTLALFITITSMFLIIVGLVSWWKGNESS